MIHLERITGKKIAEAFVAFPQDNNIQLSDMRGQGYDGAPNMSPGHSGVQARIRKLAPLATYVDCGGHCLNLIITLCLIGLIIAPGFLNSSKRSLLL